jgi:DNA-binding transcriptional LysR family regulator
MNPDDRVLNRLKLRDLRLLQAVAKWGSMAKAAKQLHVSQPAVSKGIADLEHTLGVRLLDRIATGVEPTPYGRALLRRGVAIFDELRQGVKEIEFLADSAVGELRIGCGEPMASGLVPIIIDRLTREHPGITFYLTQTTNSTLRFRELRERSVDLLIGRIPTPFDEEDLSSDVLFQEQLVVVASEQSPWARRRRIELAELADEPWHLPPLDSLVGSYCAEAFQKSGLEVPKQRVVSFSMQLQTGLLATGRFLTIIPRSMLYFGGKRMPLKALPIELPIPARPIAIVVVKNRTLGPVAQLFIDCARLLTRPLTEG